MPSFAASTNFLGINHAFMAVFLIVAITTALCQGRLLHHSDFLKLSVVVMYKATVSIKMCKLRTSNLNYTNGI